MVKKREGIITKMDCGALCVCARHNDTLIGNDNDTIVRNDNPVSVGLQAGFKTAVFFLCLILFSSFFSVNKAMSQVETNINYSDPTTAFVVFRALFNDDPAPGIAKYPVYFNILCDIRVVSGQEWGGPFRDNGAVNKDTEWIHIRGINARRTINASGGAGPDAMDSNDGFRIDLEFLTLSNGHRGNVGGYVNWNRAGGQVYVYDVIFVYNSADNGGGAIAMRRSKLFIEQRSGYPSTAETSEFYYNYATSGGALYASNKSTVSLKNKPSFSANSAKSGGAIYLEDSSALEIKQGVNGKETIVSFDGNSASSRGGAIYATGAGAITIASGVTVRFQNNSAGSYSGAISLLNANFTANTAVLEFLNNVAGGGGVADLGENVSNNSIMTFNYSTVTFQGNRVSNSGGHGSVFTVNYNAQVNFTNSKVIFYENYYNNNPNDAGASQGMIYLTASGRMSFNGGQLIITGHTRGKLTFLSGVTGNFTLTKNTEVIFTSNNRTGNGIFDDFRADIQGWLGSNGTIDNKTVSFVSNSGSGALFVPDSARSLIFSNSIINFARNNNIRGAAIYTNPNSRILFSNSSVSFKDNKTSHQGGAIYSNLSTFVFTNALVAFTSNANPTYSGGAIGILSGGASIFTFTNSTVSFTGNTAGSGGGAILAADSTFTFTNSNVSFTRNIAAGNSGGAISDSLSTFTFTNSMVSFTGNIAIASGGAIITSGSTYTFTNSMVSFTGNTAALHGGAIFMARSIMSVSSGALTFTNNSAVSGGGAIHLQQTSSLTIAAHTANFSGNKMNGKPNDIYSDNSKIYIRASGSGNSGNISFGGGLQLVNNSLFDVRGRFSALSNSRGTIVLGNDSFSQFTNSTVYFERNTGEETPLLFGLRSTAIFTNVNVKFTSNTAVGGSISGGGAAFYMEDASSVSFTGNSAVFTYNTSFLGQGGAIVLDNGGPTSASPKLYFINVISVFENNRAMISNGGAISNFTATAISTVQFVGGSARFVQNIAGGLGGAIYNTGYLSFQNNTAYFSGNTASAGGAVYTQSAASVFINNSFLNFLNNTASGYGGAIASQSGSTFNFSYSTASFTGNTTLASDGYGGAIRSYNSSWTFFNSSVNFTSNTAPRGGAIYINNNSKFYFNGGTFYFRWNYGNEGGAIAYQGSDNGGLFHFGFNTAFLTKVLFEGNTAAGGGGAIDTRQGAATLLIFDKASSVTFVRNTAWTGGALWIRNNSSASFTGALSFFIGNEASNGGGAIRIGDGATGAYFYFNGGTVSFISNKTSLSGGAIAIINSGNLIISASSTFIGNSAANYGGAVYIDGTTTVFSSFTSPALYFTLNTASSGGAFYTNKTKPDFSATTIAFTSNVALSSGGAFYAANASSIIFKTKYLNFLYNKSLNGDGVLFVDPTSYLEFSSAMATLQAIGNTANNGGFLYLDRTTMAFNAPLIIISSNSARGSGKNGGGMYFNGSSISFNKSSVVFSWNRSINSAGGAIYADANSRILFSNSSVSFKGNGANSQGGAIYSNFSTFIFSNVLVDFTSNANTDNIHSGGAILANGSSFTFANSTVSFIGNTAGNSGGAISANGSSFTFANSMVSFVGNISSNLSGGAISASGSSFTFANSTVSFIGNTVGNSGGAINASGSTFTFTNTSATFIRNSAGNYGGAISISNSILNLGFGTNSFILNSAGIGGGAIWFNNVKTVFEGAAVNFTSNIASSSGGAIYANNGSSVIFKTRYLDFFYNKSLDGNGVLFVDPTSYFEFSSAIARLQAIDNTANNGGFLYIERSTLAFNTLLIVSSNTARVADGGGFYVSSGSLIFGANSTIVFSGNSAARNGGGLYFAQGSIDILGDQVRIERNMAGVNGGAIYFNDASLIFKGTSLAFTSNVALSSGGALYGANYSSVVFNTKYLDFFYNKSLDGNGVFFIDPTSYFEFSTAIARLQAIDNTANNGGFLYLERSTMAFNTLVIIASNTAAKSPGYGGGLYLSSGSLIFGTNSTVIFSSNSAARGGGLYIAQGAIDILGKIIIDKNVAGNVGGGIYFNNAVLKFDGSSIAFTSNIAISSGGALYGANYSSVIFNTEYLDFFYNKSLDGNGVFFVDPTSYFEFSTAIARLQAIGNTANNGGFLYLERSTLTFNTLLIVSSNTARIADGGGLYLSSGSLIFGANSTIVFSGNSAARNGGGLYFAKGKIDTLGQNIKVERNYAGATGGGIYFNNASLIFSGSSLAFTSNVALSSGGALYGANYSSVVFNTEYLDFFYNKSLDGNGAFFIEPTSYFEFSTAIARLQAIGNTANNGGFLFLDRGTLSFNTLLIVASNTARAGEGGGAFFSKSSLYLSANSTVIFSANSASGRGGAIYTDNASLSFNGISMSFTSNVAMSSGGAFYSANYSTVVFNTQYLSFYFNMSSRGYGVLSLDPTSTMEMSSGIKELIGYGNSALNGGFLFLNTTTFTFNTFVLIEKNYAFAADSKGGGLYLIDSVLNLSEHSTVAFRENTAFSGGGVYFKGGFFNIKTGALFYGNYAKGYGGGGYFTASSITFNGSSISFTSNIAVSSGGAIYAVNGSTIIFNTEKILFNYNQSLNGDGVLYWADSSIHFSSAVAELIAVGNTANNGGFLYLQDKNLYFNSLTDISSNIALRGAGGGLFLTKSTMTFGSDSIVSFSYNTAKTSGGAIYAYNNAFMGLLGVTTLSFIGNTAGTNGAAIYALGISSVIINTEYLEFLNNETKGGDGVIYYGDSNVVFSTSIKYLKAEGNKALSGGFLYLINKTLKFDNEAYISVSSNTALTGNGGGMYLKDMGITFGGLSSTVFSYNTASAGYGGVFYLDHAVGEFLTATMSFIKNTAQKGGATVYGVNNSSIIFNNKYFIFIGNESLDGIGVLGWENSYVSFAEKMISLIAIDNKASSAGFLYVKDRGFAFDKGLVNISSNTAVRGDAGAMLLINSSISFGNGSTASITYNTARGYGGAFYFDHAIGEFNTATITFIGNTSGKAGGTIYAVNGSSIVFSNKNMIFIDNESMDGDGVITWINSYVSFSSKMAMLLAVRNRANNAGFLYLEDRGMTFDKSKIDISSNIAKIGDAGAMLLKNSTIVFNAGSTVTISWNTAALYGGAFYLDNTLAEFNTSTITLIGNTAGLEGGVIYAVNKSSLIFNNEHMIIRDNVSLDGDGVLTWRDSFMSLSTNMVTFLAVGNKANNAGLLWLEDRILALDRGYVDISSNIARSGHAGALYLKNSTISFGKSAIVKISYNTSYLDGGAFYFDKTVGEFNTATITFTGNTAAGAGGVIYAVNNSSIIFNDLYTFFIDNVSLGGDGVLSWLSGSKVIFSSHMIVLTALGNKAQNGGFLYLDGRTAFDIETSVVNVSSNYAFGGGASGNGIGGGFYINQATMGYRGVVEGNFINNTALSSGGALYIDRGTLNFVNNQYINFEGNKMGVLGNDVFLSTSVMNVLSSASSQIIRMMGGVISFNGIINVKGSASYTISGWNYFTAMSSFGIIGRSKTIVENASWTYIKNSIKGINAEISEFEINSSSAVFLDNKTAANAPFGAALNLLKSSVSASNSNLEFSKNTSGKGGAVKMTSSSFSVLDSFVKFKENEITRVNDFGGAINADFSTISFSGTFAEFTGNSSQNGAGGLAIYSFASSVSFKNSEVIFLSHFSLSNSGGAINSSNSYFNFDNTSVTFAYNKINTGGAIYASKTSMSFSGEYAGFIKNTAFGAGGAIYAVNASIISFASKNLFFDGNLSAGGDGVVFADDKSNIIGGAGIDNLIAVNNRALNGGFLYLFSDRSYFDINAAGNVKISSNAAIETNGKGVGGAFYLKNGARLEVSGANVDISYNTAVSSGGAIFAENASNIYLKAVNGDIVFKGNRAQYGKNDIFITSSVLLISNFNNNSIRLEDGVYAFDKSIFVKEGLGMLYMSGKNHFEDMMIFGVDTGSYVLVEDATWTYTKNTFALSLNNAAMDYENTEGYFTGNIAKSSGSGGALKAWNASRIKVNNSSISFAGNTSGVNGGAIFLESGSEMIFTHSTISVYRNIAQSSGGAFALNNGSIYFNDMEEINISSNTSRYQGSAIYLTNNSEMNFGDIKVLGIKYNWAQNGDGTIYWDDTSNLVLNNIERLEAIGNTAQRGGFLFLDGQKTLTLSDVEAVIEGNTAVLQSGGGIYLAGGAKITFDNSHTSFNYNRAQQRGGGIYLTGGSTMGFYNGSVEFGFNTANTGAAFYLENGSYLDFAGISILNISSNVSTYSNGVIYWDRTSAINFSGISEIKAIGNRADSGGFLFLEGRDFDLAAARVIVGKNRADILGGGVYLIESRLIWNGVESAFSSNSAVEGGGIYLDRSSIIFDGGRASFSGNTAYSSGASIYLSNNSLAQFKSLNYLGFNGNLTSAGNGAIYWDKSSAISMENIYEMEAIGNRAQNGGFLYFEDSDFILSGAQTAHISSNTAFSGNGGAFYLKNSSFSLSGLSLTAQWNKAKRDGSGAGGLGGFIYAENSTISLKADSGDMVLKNNFADNVKNDVYMDFAELNLINVNGNQIRFEGGVYAVNKSALKKEGDGLLYFSGRNYFDAVRYFDLAPGSEMLSENAQWTYINNENPLNLNSSSVSFIGGVSEFINNSAQNFGAGIYASNSKVLFRKGSVSFIKNTSQAGAVVYADNASDILFENIDVLNISENHSIAGNSVFSAQNASQINFADVSSASVINNKAQNGAFLYLDNSNFVLTGGKWFNASGNIAEDSSSIGGAIAVIQGEFAVNAASIVFTSNTAQTGGAIYAQNSEIKLNSNNGYILFEENSAQAGTDIYLDNSKFYLTASGAKSAAKLDGGIEAYNGSVLEFKGNITLNRKNILENSSLAIEDGKVNIGGEFSFSRGLTEMQIRKSTVSIKGSSSESVKFISNNGGGIGGAVSVYDSSLEIIDGKISGNRGSAAGAIYLENSILRIAAQEGDFVFSSNTFNGIKNDISFNSAELIFYAQGASSKQTSMAQWYERRYDGMNGQKSAARVYATPIPARDDYKQIILNGGMFGSGAVTKEGGGELILRGRNEISDALTINAGIVSLDTASFKAASIDIKRGSVYNTYRGETGIGGNVTTLSGRLTVEASTVSLGLYFNEERTNPVSADSIFASSIMNRNGSLKITAYGEISEYADALNDVMLMKWNDIHSAVNFGYGGAAMWFDGDLWKGYVGYQLEVRNASELWLVILSTGLGLVGTGGNFTYNEREAAGMLNRVDFNTLAAIKMRIPVSEIKDEALLRKTLGQISGEFLANVLKMGALYDESAKIFPRLYREAGEAERPSIWAQADMSSIFRKDEGSVREYSSSLIGFQAGINLKRRSDELFGIYGSQESGELKQDLDRADMKDISGGIYWGSFNNWASMKWTAGFGQQSYDVKREVNIGTQSYSPQSSFDTYSIRGSGEVEFEFFNNDSSFVINPVIGAQAAYIINSEIDESEGDLAELLVKSAAYPRLTFTGGLRFRGEGDFTRWNFSLYAGYAVLGGQDFSYQMTLKSAESDGKMEIKPNYEGDMFAGLSFGIEASLSNNLSLYASADAKISPSAENKLLGYAANAGLKLRFGTAKARPKPEPKPEPQKPAPEIKPDPIADTIPQIAPEIVTQDFSSLDDLDEASLISMLNNLEGEVGKRVSDEDKKLLVEAQERRKNLIKSFRLSAAVFRSGSAELTAESKNDIRKLAQSLKEYEYNKITVEGHTDSTGQAEKNRVLSFERARSVYLELVKNGIPREKLDYVGFGAMMPVSSNKTEVGKRQNRRVEVFVEGDSKDAQAQRLTLERDNYLNYENSLNRQGGDDMEISASQRERSAIDNAAKQTSANPSVKKTQSVKAQSVKTASKKAVAVKPAAKVKKTSSVKKTAPAKTAATKRAAAKSGVSAKNTAKKKIKK